MHHMWSRPSHELVLVPDFLPRDRVIISFYIFHRARSNYAGWFDSTHTSHAHWDAVADWTIIEIDRVQGSAIHDYTGMYHVSLPLHLIQLSHREGAQSSSVSLVAPASLDENKQLKHYILIDDLYGTLRIG